MSLFSHLSCKFFPSWDSALLNFVSPTITSIRSDTPLVCGVELERLNACVKVSSLLLQTQVTFFQWYYSLSSQHWLLLCSVACFLSYVAQVDLAPISPAARASAAAKSLSREHCVTRQQPTRLKVIPGIFKARTLIFKWEIHGTDLASGLPLGVSCGFNFHMFLIPAATLTHFSYSKTFDPLLSPCSAVSSPLVCLCVTVFPLPYHEVLISYRAERNVYIQSTMVPEFCCIALIVRCYMYNKLTKHYWINVELPFLWYHI